MINQNDLSNVAYAIETVLPNAIDGKTQMDNQSLKYIQMFIDHMGENQVANHKQIAELQEKLTQSDYVINKLDTYRKGAEDKLHRRNLQIAELKKKLANQYCEDCGKTNIKPCEEIGNIYKNPCKFRMKGFSCKSKNVIGGVCQFSSKNWQDCKEYIPE
jgi:small-conductance mechanosensitive channel